MTPARRPSSRRAGVLAAVLVVIAGVPLPAAALAARTRIAVAPGVRAWTEQWRATDGSRQHSALVSVDLTNRHVSVDAVPAWGHLNGHYQTVRQMVVGNRAVVGLNGDFFPLGTTTGVPVGGLVSRGAVLKTPTSGFRASFVIRADGTAAIGAEQFTGTVRVGALVQPLRSYNTVADAVRGRITLLTPAMVRTDLPSGCAVAFGTLRLGTFTVTRRIAKTAVRASVSQLPGGRYALLACQQRGTWLRNALPTGAVAHVSATFTSPRPRALVDGAQLLLTDGVPVSDSTGHHIRGRHAESFVCVSGDHRHLLLGTVDVDPVAHEYGVTMAQLQAYLRTKGSACRSAMALDGGGSSTLDYRTSARAPVRTLNHLAYGYERPIPDALLVSYR